jgi:hypothetical protein
MQGNVTGNYFLNIYAGKTACGAGKMWMRKINVLMGKKSDECEME